MDKGEKCTKPDLETVLVQSVICSKMLRLAGTAKTDISNKFMHMMDIRFVPDTHSIELTAHLLQDLIVVQGQMRGDLVINHECFTKVNLMFQEEIVCEGVCPGDVVKMTNPILVGVIPPQKLSNDNESCVLFFKAIIRTQVTVIREKLGTVAIQIIGDVNDDRCYSPVRFDTVVRADDCNDCYIEEMKLEDENQ